MAAENTCCMFGGQGQTSSLPTHNPRTRRWMVGWGWYWSQLSDWAVWVDLLALLGGVASGASLNLTKQSSENGENKKKKKCTTWPRCSEYFSCRSHVKMMKWLKGGEWRQQVSSPNVLPPEAPPPWKQGWKDPDTPRSVGGWRIRWISPEKCSDCISATNSSTFCSLCMWHKSNNVSCLSEKLPFNGSDF